MSGISYASPAPGTLPRAVFLRMKNALLGEPYELSVVTVSARAMREANALYRGKNEPTDILSFPLSKTSGEILLHLPTVRMKARRFSLTPAAYLRYLFIHGCLHLKGHDHGRTMDALEKKWCAVFDTPYPHH